MSSSGRDISAPPGLPDGWKATQHHDTDSSDSSSVGRSYVRFHSIDGKHENIPTVKEAIRIHCKDQGSDPKLPIAQFELAELQLTDKWEATAKQYGASSKLAGQTYCTFASTAWMVNPLGSPQSRK